jgi:hypothetical protein
MPSIINATTSTGLVSSADNSGSLQLATNNGTTAVTIDTSQNVGIGTASPSAPLDIQSNSGGTGIRVRGRASANAGAIRYFANDNTTQRARIESNDTSLEINSISSLPITFNTADTERMRITSDGNLLFGTTATNVYGNFVNAKASATLSASETSGQTQFQNFSRVQTSTPVASSTVESFRFLRADGTVIGANRIIGHVYVYADALGGGNSFIGIYTIISHGNGTSDATLTLDRSTTRGVSPVSSISLADDGAGGGVKINITYTNLGGGGVAGRTTVSFVGQV